MTFKLYSTGCPTCGKDRKIINKARKILDGAGYRVEVYNNRWDKQAFEAHSKLVAEKFHILDSRPTVIVREDGKALLLTNATEDDIYGLMA